MNAGPSALSVIAGRYVLGEVIGRGGAATVHLGKPSGEGRRGVVAIKRLHPHLAADPAFVAMMLDEARLMSRVRHRNVVQTLDVLLQGGELYIVMEYVHGATLGALLAKAHARKARAPVPVACAIARDALLGLHAAHEATGNAGEPLGMVHRDVSPQNLLVAEDGVLKVVDFGIAKAEGRVQQTEDGSIKGKLGYMPPEQLFGDALDRRADVYAMGVVLWEAIVGERLFAGENDAPALVKSLVAAVDPPSDRAPGVGEAIDRVVLRALSHDRGTRFATAQAMADALCEAQAPAKASEVGSWVRSLVADTLDERGARLFVFDRAARDLLAETRARESMISMDGAGASRRRTWVVAMAAALCAAGGGGAAVLFGASSPEDPAKAADAASASGAAATTTSATTTSAAATTSSGTSSVEAPAEGPPSSAAPSVGSGAATAPISASRSGPAPRGSAPSTVKPASKADGCDPPFTIDAQGHKRYKRECLR